MQRRIWLEIVWYCSAISERGTGNGGIRLQVCVWTNKFKKKIKIERWKDDQGSSTYIEWVSLHSHYKCLQIWFVVLVHNRQQVFCHPLLSMKLKYCKRLGQVRFVSFPAHTVHTVLWRKGSSQQILCHLHCLCMDHENVIPEKENIRR